MLRGNAIGSRADICGGDWPAAKYDGEPATIRELYLAEEALLWAILTDIGFLKYSNQTRAEDRLRNLPSAVEMLLQTLGRRRRFDLHRLVMRR